MGFVFPSTRGRHGPPHNISSRVFSTAVVLSVCLGVRSMLRRSDFFLTVILPARGHN